MNKFNLIGTVKNLERKQFQRGGYTGTLLKFQITYPINKNQTKMTTFMCSTFSETIINKLKDGDQVNLIDYIPTSDKYRNNQGQYMYFNSLIVRELSWVAKSVSNNIGELEQEMIFDNFDVNSYQENYGEEEALVDVPRQEIDYFGMLNVQQEKINNQPEVDTEFDVVLSEE